MFKQLSILLFFLLFTQGCVSSSFQEIKVPYEHAASEDNYPFSGVAAIDVDGDGSYELFVSGSNVKSSALLKYENEAFIDITKEVNLVTDKTVFSALSLDLDNDGNEDLLLSKEDGVYLYTNIGGKFKAEKLDIKLPKESIVLNIATLDLNRDGRAELYLSNFVDFKNFRSGVFNEEGFAKPNILLENLGGGKFKDITKQTGLEGLQNTFLSTFVDLDNDGYQDVILAQNTGQIEIFKNQKDMTFKKVPLASGYGFWMGLAIADYDNDGDQDFFATNSGSSIPSFLVKGDLREDQEQYLDLALFRNEGNFKFTKLTEEVGLEDLPFGWGAVFEDIDSDGNLDLLMAQNYIKWPFHRLFKNSNGVLLSKNGKFIHDSELGLNNSYYGQTPLVADFNNDNRVDIAWLNMDGPLRVLLNKQSEVALKVRIEQKIANFGTKVSVESSSGKVYTKEFIANSGFNADHAPEMFFYLPKGEKVKTIVVTKPYTNEKIYYHDYDKLILELK